MERFTEKVSREPNGCWRWTAAQNGKGYGVFAFGPRKRGVGLGNVLAHRWIYEQTVGEIGDGLELDHLCRNRLCVNPAHLEAVTRQENQLRGESVSGRAARRTQCPKGHLLDGVRRQGEATQRYCKTCNRARYHARRRGRSPASVT